MADLDPDLWLLDAGVPARGCPLPRPAVRPDLHRDTAVCGMVRPSDWHAGGGHEIVLPPATRHLLVIGTQFEGVRLLVAWSHAADGLGVIKGGCRSITGP